MVGRGGRRPRRTTIGLVAVMLAASLLAGGPAAPAAAADAVLVGAGDIASCDLAGDEQTALLLDAIPGTVFTLGDNAYNAGSAQEFANCYAPTWGRHKARTRPAVGNHEYGRAGASGHAGYYGAAAGPSGKYYYSYGRGSWHVVVLNSRCEVVSCAAGSAQETWLRADLASHPNACTLAYWHHPRWSSGSGASSEVQPLWQALSDYRADVVLWGHSHHYERFAPMAPSGGKSATGIRAFIVGTGGARTYATSQTPAANSEVRNSRTLGVLELTLGAGGYSWAFVPVAGQTFTDAGTGSCH